MRNKRLFLIILVAGISILWASQVLSFSRTMHRDLNERIAQRVINNFSLNDYLINQLGFREGVREILGKESDKLRIFEWLGEGGDKEDEPEALYLYPINAARNNRHFHDPLESWDKAGLSTPIFTSQSSLMWAQNPDQNVGGKWSWKDARDYFYRGLTFYAKTERDLYFANAFRALGQLMHLIQDASVPSHTRNDIHAIYHYESWVEDVRKNWSGKYNSWISTPITYDKSILDLPLKPLAPIPIAKIMDTDRYTRDNQDIESTKSLAIGLAEYSNGNFFSEDTCFVAWYPFPNWVCVETVPYQIVDPRDRLRTVSRQYYKKDPTVTCGETNEGKGYRLATVGFLKDYVLRYFPLSAQILRAFEKPALDANVYGDYASLLMPRAVGYSAGLLEYFFRGKLDFEISDFKSNGDIEITITNLSEDTLVEGVFELYYDNNQGNRTKINLSQSAANNISKDVTLKTTFTSPNDFETGKEDQYMLVYNGKLGNEDKACIGKQKLLRKIVPVMVTYYRDDNKILFKVNNSSENLDIENFYVDLDGIVDRNCTPFVISVVEHKPKMGALLYKVGTKESAVYKVLKFKVTGKDPGGEQIQGESGGGFYRYDFEHSIEEFSIYIGNQSFPLFPVSFHLNPRYWQFISQQVAPDQYPVSPKSFVVYLPDRSSEHLEDLQYELFGLVPVRYEVAMLGRGSEYEAWQNITWNYFIPFGVYNRNSGWVNEPINFFDVDGVVLSYYRDSENEMAIYTTVSGGVLEIIPGVHVPEWVRQVEIPFEFFEAFPVFEDDWSRIKGYLINYKNQHGGTYIYKYFNLFTPGNRRELLWDFDEKYLHYAPARGINRGGGGKQNRAMCRLWYRLWDYDGNETLYNRYLYLLENVLYKDDQQVPISLMDPVVYPFSRQARELLLAKEAYNLYYTPVLDSSGYKSGWTPYRDQIDVFYQMSGKVKDEPEITGTSEYVSYLEDPDFDYHYWVPFGPPGQMSEYIYYMWAWGATRLSDMGITNAKLVSK